MPSRATLAAAAAAAAAAFAGLVLHRRRRRSPVADDDLPERIVSQHWRDEGAQPRMLSGASPGADTLFGAAAARAGHVVVHFLGPNNEPSETAAREQADSLCRVQRATIEHPSVTAALRDAAAAEGGEAAAAAAAMEELEARLAAREAALAKEVGTSKGELDTSRGIARALGSLRKAVAQMRPGA